MAFPGLSRSRCLGAGAKANAKRAGMGNPLALFLFLLVTSLALFDLGAASEFPDRECCDSAPPPPPQYHTVTSTSTTSTPQPPPYGGSMEQKEHKTLNCLMAKQLCDEDSNCSAILKVIPTLCGPELGE
ncbi:hypothetical protein C7M84_010464 [Penaeus vannamei]|uniref:Uncharacterized protein n=1 Tax=Penaeus vannamei TaxID=6689 RepID=A0A3R7QLG9_PENVA|nr:hypothetical protein C7M84_010464 [Penaeus vannamei]